MALGGIGQLSTIYLSFGKYLKRSGNTSKQAKIGRVMSSVGTVPPRGMQAAMGPLLEASKKE